MFLHKSFALSAYFSNVCYNRINLITLIIPIILTLPEALVAI